MLFRNKKRNSGGNEKRKAEVYRQFMQAYSLSSTDFLESFSNVVKLVQAQSASLYFYDEPAGTFLLKKWHGDKPARFAISNQYELIKYIKVKQAPLVKKDFIQSTHDLRQAALFFFQQTLSTHIFPICFGENWQGLLFVNLETTPAEDVDEVFDLCLRYSRELMNWLQYQNVLQENKKLSEISHVKNQLLANVSHELQTPLNGILGISEAILDGADGEISEDVRSHVQMIRESGKALFKTITDFLKLAQIEARKSEITHEKTNMNELIQDVASLYLDSLKKRNIALELPETQKSVYVFVEPDQIRTVLMNLLSNATKFTEAGEVRLSTKKSGDMLYVSVADTGIGIARDSLDLVFEEFYQADGSHTRVYGGTGLGLAIAKKIINLHGGRIWAEPNRGKGTNFTFTVPLCPGV